MKIAIISDIHGNREALTSIMEDIAREDIDEVICLGDVIGIGPNSKECLDMIINNNIEMVLGNHELYFLNGTDIDDELSEDVKRHHRWLKEQITDKQKQFLEKCNLTIEKDYDGKKILFEHFPIDCDPKNQYPFYDSKIIEDGSIRKIAELLKYDLVFVGHKHADFNIDNKLYGIGSSGCRKDNITKYTILDTDTLDVKVKNIEYDRNGFEKDLLKQSYPARDFVAKLCFGVEI